MARPPLALWLAASAVVLTGFAPAPLPDPARAVGKPLPNVAFDDDAGRRRDLGSLAGQPMIVLPMYTTCHASCPTLARALKKAVVEADIDARTVQVFLFSFDEETTASQLADFRRELGLPASWVLARLDGEAIRRLTDALDYRVSWQAGEWVHPNAVAFASPDQRVAAFVYGEGLGGGDIRRAVAVADGATDWRTRASPWALSLGTVGLTLSMVSLVHALGRTRRSATSAGARWPSGRPGAASGP